VHRELDPDLPHVTGHPVHLMEAISHLILNAAQALEAVSEPRAIRVETRGIDGRVRILVEDNGTGVAAEIAPRIFEPFFSTRDSSKSSGLGLTLALRIVQDHGGALTFEPKRPRGARFIVDLAQTGSFRPVEEPAQAAADPAPDTQDTSASQRLASLDNAASTLLQSDRFCGGVA
jgi:signal transduction histidine kinase